MGPVAEPLSAKTTPELAARIVELYTKPMSACAVRAALAVELAPASPPAESTIHAVVIEAGASRSPRVAAVIRIGKRTRGAVAKLEAALAAGLGITRASAAAGITRETGRHWRRALEAKRRLEGMRVAADRKEASTSTATPLAWSGGAE